MVRASSSRPAELDGDLYDDYALDLETGDAHETERPRVRERRRPAKGVVTVTVLLFAGALDGLFRRLVASVLRTGRGAA